MTTASKDRPSKSRRGTSYLEIQVAMVVLAVGIGGLYSISIVQTKQTQRLGEVLPSTDIAALNEAASPWQKKLGVYASVDDATTPKSVPVPHTDFVHIIDNSDSSRVTFFPSSSSMGEWLLRTGSGYRGSYHEFIPKPNTDTFSYALMYVPNMPVGELEVLVTYDPASNTHPQARYYVYVNGFYQAMVTIDQRTEPMDVQYDGVNWDRLGQYQNNGGPIYVLAYKSYGFNQTQRMRVDGFCVRSRKSLSVVTTQFDADGGMTAVLDEVVRPPAP